jgi:hypothetical protein
MTHSDFRKRRLERPLFLLQYKGFTAKSSLSEHQTQEYLSLSQLQQLMVCCFVPSPRLSFIPTWFKLIRIHKASAVGVFIVDNNEKPFSNQDEAHFQNVIRVS